MECKCGGSTTDHQVIKNYTVVGGYAKCNACGRIHWWEKPNNRQIKCRSRSNMI